MDEYVIGDIVMNPPSALSIGKTAFRRKRKSLEKHIYRSRSGAYPPSGAMVYDGTLANQK
jgi:hypothetical protein